MIQVIGAMSVEREAEAKKKFAQIYSFKVTSVQCIAK